MAEERTFTYDDGMPLDRTIKLSDPPSMYKDMKAGVTEMKISEVPSKIGLDVGRAHDKGNFHEVLTHYVDGAIKENILTPDTVEGLRGLSQEAFEARHDVAATDKIYKRVLELLGKLRVQRGV